MPKQLIVPGHSLVAEGAPFKMDPRGEPVRIKWNSTAGPGRALCSCALISPELSTAAARKRWHETHKLNVLDATDASGSAAIDPKKDQTHG